MLPVSALKSMNVLWATPCYNAGVSMNYVTSMFELAHAGIRAGLQSSLTLRAESLVTKGRNGIVKHFLMNEQYTHLFWIDADIQFQPAAAFRLLLSDLDVAAGAYPIKTFNWPSEGLPHGMTRETFEAAYSEYPFNLIGLGAEPIAKFVTPDDFVEVAEGADRIHGDQAACLHEADRQLSRAQLHARRPPRQSRGEILLAVL